MKVAAKGKILPLVWLLIAVFQLFLIAQLAPAKSAFILENRTWEIFSLADQSHQIGQLQVAEGQQERAPPFARTASDELLGPESEINSVGSNIALDANGNQLLLTQGSRITSPSLLLPDANTVTNPLPETETTNLIVHPFADGATHITTTAQLDRYAASPTIGGPNGLFVAPTSQIDELLANGASRADIEAALGLEPGALSTGDVVRIDISDPFSRNLSLPTSGNRFFRPETGLTWGNLNEGVIASPLKTDPSVKPVIVPGL
jgi:hypothetical protein